MNQKNITDVTMSTLNILAQLFYFKMTTFSYLKFTFMMELLKIQIHVFLCFFIKSKKNQIIILA